MEESRYRYRDGFELKFGQERGEGKDKGFNNSAEPSPDLSSGTNALNADDRHVIWGPRCPELNDDYRNSGLLYSPSLHESLISSLSNKQDIHQQSMSAKVPITVFNSLQEIYPSASAVLREG